MKIVLAITGSISAHKAIDLTRDLTKRGHEIKVLCSKGALNFVTPQTFRVLGAKEVYLYNDDFNYPRNNETGVLHIELAKWCDKFVIAPLTANTIADIAAGKADNLITSTFLALGQQSSIILFPAMNTRMYNHPFTKSNMEKLKTLPNLFIHPPDSGELACGDTGIGKLPSVEKITAVIEALDLTKAKNNRKSALITTGATISPLDPVRYLTNPSSGLTGYYLAAKLISEGIDVTVIAGTDSTNKLDYLTEIPGYNLIRVHTTKEMHQAVMKYFGSSDFYISAAAINDIEFDTKNSKLKKESLNELKTLPIFIAKDILKDVLKMKTIHQKIVGFAAETDLTDEILLRKWNDKPVDLLVGTYVSSGKSKNDIKGFQANSAKYALVENGEVYSKQVLSKQMLSNEIFSKLNQ